MPQFDIVPKFSSGRIVITANAAKFLSSLDVTSALRRHLQGDWVTWPAVTGTKTTAPCCTMGAFAQHTAVPTGTASTSSRRLTNRARPSCSPRIIDSDFS
jgi:Flp pilus assembly protein TadG